MDKVVLFGGAVILIGLLVIVSAFDRQHTVDDTQMNVLCLDGVEYWYRKSGYNAIMSPRFNDDGKIVTCERIP